MSHIVALLLNISTRSLDVATLVGVWEIFFACCSFHCGMRGELIFFELHNTSETLTTHAHSSI
jgi:hypothetical protein